MSNNLAAELTVRSQIFWTALLAILDDQEDCARNIHNERERFYPLDEEFFLKGNDQRIWLVQKETGKALCIQDMRQKDSFPYTKILDRYLKLSVLDKLS